MAKVAKLGQYGRYAEIKAAASVYVAEFSELSDSGKKFISQPKKIMVDEIAYTSGCHYSDGILPIRTDCPLRPP